MALMERGPTAQPPVERTAGGRDRREFPGHHPGADRGGSIDPGGLRSVLVVRADNIGDVVMAGPALCALRAVAPQARIDLLASPAGSQAASMLPEIDAVVETSAAWQQLPGSHDGAPGGAAAAQWRLLNDLSRADYDALVVFTSPTQSPWPVAHLGLLAGIAVRVVHSLEFGGTVATHWVTPPRVEVHQVDRCLHLLESVGLAPEAPSRHLSLRIPVAAQQEADAVLADSGLRPGSPFALLVPGASCPARRYPAARFAAAATAVATSGLPVRVSGSARESGLVADVVERARHPLVAGLSSTSVPAFAGVLGRASVAVTNNSGGMHVADAVGTPLVVLWSGTEPTATYQPRDVPAELLGRAVPCSPCRLLACPLDHGCLDIDPMSVAEAAVRLAARTPDNLREALCTR